MGSRTFVLYWNVGVIRVCIVGINDSAYFSSFGGGGKECFIFYILV
jgi:hypothetical protein